MHFFHVPEPGVLELNYMWLPTFLGMNTRFKQSVEQELAPKVAGRPLDEGLLEELDGLLIDLVTAKFPFPGLRDYLDALKFVQET